MTEQNNQQFPNENDTATLNQMAADIRTLQSDMNFVKAELAKRTNPEFLSAFSQILKDVITDLKAEIKADLDLALAQQKAELKAEIKADLDLALAQQKADFEQALANQEVKFEQALNNLRDEMVEEFKLVRREIRGIERRFHPITKDICSEAMRVDELEDRVEKLEAKLAS
ncbi:MAG: hypothetical protein WAQ98_23135 [Blastocatellia bacterium]